jgi:tetratricopeptide (TPR) repeat protein
MQRTRDLKNLQNSQQFTLVMICLVAGLGIAGVAAMSIYMLRYIHRRTEMVGTAHPIGVPYAAGALGNGNTRLAGPDPAAQSSAQLLGALERMEKRMIELESVTPAETNGAFLHAGQSDLAPEARAQTDLQARVSLLLGKGQSLLSLEQFDEAIACLDEAIALDPTNAEAFEKKGTALEKQGHLDEAIENYDRAIVLDDSLTMAYLCKGGVYNRLDRYSEALQCYEQALRAQQDARVG